MATAPITLIPAYESQAVYVQAARAADNPNLAQLYREYVFDPLWPHVGGASVHGERVRRVAGTPIRDLDGLEQAVAALREQRPEPVIEEVLAFVAETLDGVPMTVAVLAADPEHPWHPRAFPGALGLSAGPGRIWVALDPIQPWVVRLGPVLAREAYLSTLLGRNFPDGEKPTLRDRLAAAGRAELFADLTFPGREAPWVAPLPPDEEAATWATIRKQLGASKENTVAQILEGARDDLPENAGYRLAYRLARAWQAHHPASSVQTWTDLSATDFLASSGYDPAAPADGDASPSGSN